MAREPIPAWARPRLDVLVFLILLASSLVQSCVSAGDGQAVLDYHYTGSAPAARDFVRAMEHRAVQSALLEVAATPRNRAFLDAALRGTDVTAEQLDTLGLIRHNGDRYELAFSLLTREDRQKIQAVAEAEGERLADGLLAHRSTIEELLKNDPMPAVDWRATAYFILGCVSLDWDGLNLARRRGYLAVPPEGAYLPMAYQPLPREALQQLYWGSHNYHESAAVTTFGDHYSLPRTGLPDVLWRLSVEAAEPVKSKLTDVAEGLVRRHAAALMLALRDGAKSVGQLAATTGFREGDVRDVLALLVALEYVTESDGTYGAVIPVLTERDRPMVRQLRVLGQEVMLDWFAERYKPLSEELGGLTPQRYGVPLSNSFYWVWHHIFGVANRELVASGLFVDPYDSKRTFKGFIPAVYQLDVVQSPL